MSSFKANLFSVELFGQSDLDIEAASRHQSNPIDEPLSELIPPESSRELIPRAAQIFNHDIQGPPSSAIPPKPSTLRITGATSIEVVEESYRSAIQNGRLKFDRKPRLMSVSHGSPKLEPWDPYILAANFVPRAVLDEKKVTRITESVESAIQIVPKAVEWEAKSRERGLTPKDVQRILRKAFVHDKPDDNDNLPPILKIAANALRRAEELKDKHGTFQREGEVLRMVAYAVIQVSVVAGEATKDQVSAIDIVLFVALTSGARILNEVAGWGRLVEAVSHFCPTLVLGDGKFDWLDVSRLTAVLDARYDTQHCAGASADNIVQWTNAARQLCAGFFSHAFLQL